MARGKLDEDGFSRWPKQLHKDAWFYEGKGGLTVAYVARGTSQDIAGQIEIPWHKLAPAIERHRKFKQRKARAVR